MTEHELPPDLADREVRRRRARWLVPVGLALVAMMLLRAFVVQSFFVPSSSMEPTISAGDRVVVAKFGSIRRGDVIVFDGGAAFGGAPKSGLSNSFVGRSLTQAATLFSIDLGEVDYLKRVIGVGGDRVRCCDARGMIEINGTPLKEPYLEAGVAPSEDPFDVRVPAGHVFVLGDNRPNSGDSRSHLGSPGGGMIPLDEIVGRVVLRYWPMSRLDLIERQPPTSSPTS